MIEATEDVLVAICIVIIQVGFQIEYEWLSHWNTPNAKAPHAPSPSITDQALSREGELEQLMAWLGWVADEVSYEELCSADELLLHSNVAIPRRWEQTSALLST